jgi:hypothetical protein
MPTVRPVKMCGMDAGKYTSRKIDRSRAPSIAPARTSTGIDQRHAVKVFDQDREERAEEGDEDDALLVGRPKHDRHRHPGDRRDRPQHFRDREDDLVHQL